MKHAPVVNPTAMNLIGCSCGWRVPVGVADAEEAIVLHVAAVAELGSDLAQKATAWALAERVSEGHCALLTRLEDQRDRDEPIDQDLLDQTTHLWRLAIRHEEDREHALKEAARKLLDATESRR